MYVSTSKFFMRIFWADNIHKLKRKIALIMIDIIIIELKEIKVE